MIKIENLHKTLNGKKVLRGVNIQIDRGEITAIIGASGGGKTVLLKHLIGMLRPDSGEIFIKDRPIFQLSERKLEETRRLFGFVFQSGALLNSISVFDNIALPLVERRKTPPEKIQQAVREKLELVSLSGIENEMPSNLSGGMKKRVAIARAIIEDPEIILYDEPTAELDPVMASSIEELIMSLKTELGVTSVVVIHDMDIALRLADKIALLDGGEFVEIGTPDQIMESKNELVKKFLDKGMRRCMQ
jgi:phospholipid/cholesterol/gamma-HCH transport system ATP-binding protein